MWKKSLNNSTLMPNTLKLLNKCCRDSTKPFWADSVWVDFSCKTLTLPKIPNKIFPFKRIKNSMPYFSPILSPNYLISMIFWDPPTKLLNKRTSTISWGLMPSTANSSKMYRRIRNYGKIYGLCRKNHPSSLLTPIFWCTFTNF